LLTIAIAAAAATGLAVPYPASSLSHSDYPTWALARNASATSFVDITIDPEGRVAECKSIRNFGDARLAGEICDILKRKRFKPPKLADGWKVHAFFETAIRFFLPDTAEGRKVMVISRGPDAELSVNHLPTGTWTAVSISLAYDQAGRIIACERSAFEKQKTLADVACSQRAMFDNSVRRDATGQPVPYVTSKTIRFTVAALPK
jgi:hypothetical protein